MALTNKKSGYVYSGPGYEADKKAGTVPGLTVDANAKNTTGSDTVDMNKAYAPVVGYGSNSYGSGSSGSDAMTLDDYYNQYFGEDNVPEYSSKYTSKIDNILNSILNRQAFDINNDANYQQLYNNYKESYQNQARKGMADSMASAQAATGGYGNSYAAAVGQQAYDDYMSQLNDKNIDLYQLAYGMYQDETADRYNQLNAVTGLENTDYSRYRDEMNDYYTNRDYYTSRMDTQYNNAQNEDSNAYQMALSLASNGITVPSKYAMYLDDDTVSQLNTLASQAAANRYKTGSGGSKSGSANDDEDMVWTAEMYSEAVKGGDYTQDELDAVWKSMTTGEQKKYEAGVKAKEYYQQASTNSLTQWRYRHQ